MSILILVDRVILPNIPLTSLDITYALHIPAFRGVFVRDNLLSEPNKNACGILNLDNCLGNGTHWTAWYRRNGSVNYYFDSYGI